MNDDILAICKHNTVIKIKNWIESVYTCHSAHLIFSTRSVQWTLALVAFLFGESVKYMLDQVICVSSFSHICLNQSLTGTQTTKQETLSRHSEQEKRQVKVLAPSSVITDRSEHRSQKLEKLWPEDAGKQLSQSVWPCAACGEPLCPGQPARTSHTACTCHHEAEIGSAASHEI